MQCEDQRLTGPSVPVDLSYIEKMEALRCQNSASYILPTGTRVCVEHFWLRVVKPNKSFVRPASDAERFAHMRLHAQ